ncbi:MAG: phosphotransferase [Thermoanaerobaculia bacterium]
MPRSCGQDSSREKHLEWLRERGFEAEGLEELRGDVSSRRYCRVRLARGRSAVLASYPVELYPACQRFLTTTRLLQGIEIPVPAVLDADCQAGLMLLEDVGDESLYDLTGRDWSELTPLLEQAVDIACRIRALPTDLVEPLNPVLDAPLLWQELEKTWQVFLEPQGLTGSPTLTEALKRALRNLCETLGAEPLSANHRDFMARNLMLPSRSGPPVVIDHQDLRLGPRFYDLASLMNDSLFPPSSLETDLLSELIQTAEDRASYHRAAVQRTLKATGTFAAFAKHGNDRHLALIPPTLTRALYHLEQLAETRALVGPLRTAWEPFLGNQGFPHTGSPGLLD